MKPGLSTDTWLGLFFLAFALVLVLVWVPLDTGTGLVETVRRKFVIGDALGPTIAGVVIALGAVLVLLKPIQDQAMRRANWMWMARLLGLFAVTWSEGGYRPRRATAPWSYIGFLLGGTVMIGALTGLTMRRLSLRDFAIGFAAALVIALLYDVPFEDLLLPPNGDL